MTFDNKIKLGDELAGESGGSEIITVVADSDFEDDNKAVYPTNLPILPLRNTVLFPGVVFPVTIGRDKSIKLIEETYQRDKILGLVAQKDQKHRRPKHKRYLHHWYARCYFENVKNARRQYYRHHTRQTQI